MISYVECSPTPANVCPFSLLNSRDRQWQVHLYDAGELNLESTQLRIHTGNETAASKYQWMLVGNTEGCVDNPRSSISAEARDLDEVGQKHALYMRMINKWVGLIVQGASTLWACAHSTKMASYNEPSNQRCRKWLVTTGQTKIKRPWHCNTLDKMELIYARSRMKSWNSVKIHREQFLS